MDDQLRGFSIGDIEVLGGIPEHIKSALDNVKFAKKKETKKIIERIKKK